MEQLPEPEAQTSSGEEEDAAVEQNGGSDDEEGGPLSSARSRGMSEHEVLAEHDYEREAPVERIPSMPSQPNEGEGIRVWVAKAAEWPAASSKVLRAKAAAAEATDAAAQAENEGRADAAKLRDDATRAVEAAAALAEDIDWGSEEFAPYSLDEQLRAVQRTNIHEKCPAVAVEGWLSRVKAKENTKKSRYFVLTSRALVYFDKAAHSKVSSSGYLLSEWDHPALPPRFSLAKHGARVWLKDVRSMRVDDEKRQITLERSEADGGEIVLEAGNDEACHAWVDAIDEQRQGLAEAEAEIDGADASASASASEGGEDGVPNAASPDRRRRSTLMGMLSSGAAMLRRGTMEPEDPAKEAERKERQRKAEEEKKERQRKAEEEKKERQRKADEDKKERQRKAEELKKERQVAAEALAKEREEQRGIRDAERKAKEEEDAKLRDIERKKKAILAKQQREEEAKKRATMSFEALIKLKAETEARFRPVVWMAPKLPTDASEEEKVGTPTLDTLVHERFLSYLDDRDGKPLALIRGWVTKDAESAVSMGVNKDRFFVLTPYYLAYFCTESDASISSKGYMGGKAMGEKPRRLMRMGARIGLEHIVDCRANREEDEGDDLLGDIDGGAALAASKGDSSAAESIARHERERSRTVKMTGAVGSEAAASSASDKSRRTSKTAALKASLSDAVAPDVAVDNGKPPSVSAAAAAPSRARESDVAGTRLADGRCITPPKPRTKPACPTVPPPDLATRMMMKKARARIGSDVRGVGQLPRVESATLTIDLSDRIIRLQFYKIAYRDEWERLINVWRKWWRKRQEQLTLEQWSNAAAFRHSAAVASMSRDDVKRRPGGGASASTNRKGGGRRYVAGKGKGLPSA
jgi:hypothetical protein